jgi:hypothetical protein
MPVVHVSLTDEEFVDFAIMARAKGLTRVQLASEMIREGIRKDSKCKTREDAIKFNSQGLPLTQRLKNQPGIYTDADGAPLVPMYERE